MSAPLSENKSAPAVALAAPQVEARSSLVGAITLSWAPVSGATGYVLEKSNTGEAGSFTVLQTLDGAARTYRHTGLYYSQKVYYRIKAISGSETSTYSSTASATTHAESKVFNIMPLGDSNTEGGSNDVPANQKAAYRSRLAKLLDASESNGYYNYVGDEKTGSDLLKDVDHAGYGAARTQDLLELLKNGSYVRWFDGQRMGLSYTAKYLEVFTPDVILLHIGTNDISNEGVDNSQSAVDNVEKILNEIDTYEQSSGREVTVILAKIIKSVCTSGFCYKGSERSKNDVIDIYNTKLQALAGKRIGNGDRLELVDMADAGMVYDFTSNGGDMADPLHPAQQGYDKMAGVWFNALERLLNVRPQTPPDTQAPETTIASKPAAITNSKTASFTFTSNESGVTFQISLDGAAFTNAATPYSVNNLSDGEHTLRVRAMDAAGNIDETPASHTWLVDTQAPAAPVISSPAQNALLNNNKPSINGTAEAESIISLFANGQQLGTTAAGTDGKWSFTPTTALADGTQQLAAKAADAAGNSSLASSVRSFTVDTKAPETTIADKPEQVTKTNKATFSFSSNKSGVTYEASIDGAAFTTVANPHTLTGLSEGEHTLQVRATDAAGNTDATPAIYTWSVDTKAPIAPVILRVSEDRGPVTDDAITSDNTLSLSGEAEAGATVLVLKDGQAIGDTKANAAGKWTLSHENTALAAGTYMFTATATDAAGNASVLSKEFEVQVELTAPVATITSTAASPVKDAFAIRIAFNEDVYGLAAADIVVSNGTLSNFAASGKATYSANVQPATDGRVTVVLPGGKAMDIAGNVNEASNSLEVMYDGTRPHLAISSEAAVMVNQPFTVTFTFDEPVTDFALTDISVTNGAAGDFKALSPSAYTALITPQADGEVSITVAANKATDTAGNGNLAATALKRTFDAKQPTVVLSTTATSPLNAAFTIRVAFSESVTGFDATDITVVNGAASSLQKLADDAYTVRITPQAAGEVRVTVGAGAAKDMAANDNLTSNTLAVIYDADSPAATLSTTAPTLTNASFIVRLTLTEAVTGLGINDFVLVNASASDLDKVSELEYTMLVKPVGDGKVSIALPADKVQDAATNGNMASNVLELMYDATAPAGYTLGFGTEVVDYANQASVPVKVSGAEVGATYVYSVSSNKGGSAVTGTASVTAVNFNLPNLDLRGLNDGELTITFYLVDQAGNKGTSTSAKVLKQTKSVAAVSALPSIKVPFKTTYGELDLPRQVEITYTTGEKEKLNITWVKGDYNGLVAGSYVLAGQLELKEGTSNPENMGAKITVEVAPNRPPVSIKLSTDVFRPDIQPEEVIGTFTTSDPDDTEFTYEFTASGADNNLFEIINGNELHLKSNEGLSGKSVFSISVRSTDPYNNAIEKTFSLTKSLYNPEKEIKLVNAFSPDGDGINDTWKVPELRYYNQIEVTVYDRSGKRVFQTTDPEQGWDGKGADGRITDGSYFYVISIKDISLVQKGVVTVFK
ncbi:Ig-like domain-containing protein [Pontibacter oryzae]|uniref:Ig-like domain-containing protein n=1 Tax=Pontibacter oryzae TaxID=2304593 RepID=UPI0013154AB0|nr:Ig-like domain-containing protein [Pontibacter oryzae]